MPVNKACVAIIKGDKMGCLMWQAVEEGCPGTAQDKPTCKAGYVYLGDNSNDAKHVILVATSPVRGLEDVHTPAVQKATGHLFASFWADSLPAVRKTGRNYDRGFDDITTAALAINPPYFREFHQMHIHSGRRLPGIDKCIGSWAPGPLGVWQKPFLCSGLHPSQPQNQDDAVLFRTTVSSLDDIWTLYNSGIATPEMANTLAAAGGIPPNKAAYHVGMLVTQPPAWHKKKEFLVVLFAPSTKAAKNPDLGKLGRGQFMTNNVH